MHKKILALATLIMFGISPLVSAAETHQYIGVKKCSMCHKSAKKGNQYQHWLISKHSQAYHVLGTPGAKATAQKEGIAGNPQEAPKCLRCHVTAYGVDKSLLGKDFKIEDGVQCETCHGAGNDYQSYKIMKDRDKSLEAGLIFPTEEVCIKCHNTDSPNYVPFEFEEFFKKVSHPRPEKGQSSIVR